jgi:hypothetical protein
LTMGRTCPSFSKISMIIPWEPLQIPCSMSKFTVHSTAEPFFRSKTRAQGQLFNIYQQFYKQIFQQDFYYVMDKLY